MSLAAGIEAWRAQGIALVKAVDLDSRDAQTLIGAAGLIIVEATRKRFPYAGYLVNAVNDVVRAASQLATRSRYIDAPRLGPDNTFAAAACAEAGARVDIAYALMAEADHCTALALEGSCSHRRQELLYRAPAGTSDHYRPREIDVACPVHKARPGEPCR